MALEHVLWIGGPPGAGKTTVATRLARHGLRWYGADTRTWAHRDRAIAEGNAAAIRWEAMRPDERGTAPPADLLAMSLHRERGPMIVDDLRSLPTSPLIVAEGSPVSPALVTALADPSRAVWLNPTPEFQRARIQSPLYELLASEIERDAKEHGVTMLTVDGSRGIDETVAAVEELFAEPLAAGARAETLAERRALLREANEAIVEQVRGYYARPWADGDAESVVREFLCECGDPGCDTTLAAQVRDAAAAPLVAVGHAPRGSG